MAEANQKSQTMITEATQKAQQMIARWRQLAIYLIVKYNDMAVKPEKDGKFQLTATGMPQRVARPGYSDYFKRELIKQTGDKYLCPEE